jgi:DNA-binding CsgD family transcriptional regulator
MGNAPGPRGVKKTSGVQAVGSAEKEREAPPKTAPGLLLMDSSLSPLLFNTEAIEILSYPDKLANLTYFDVLVAAKVRSNLLSEQVREESSFVNEFWSGRRRYFCRTFFVDSYAKDLSLPCIALLLERGPCGLASLHQVSQQFNLTQREREALEYLLQGLTTKAIASRMSISPNTVKALLRIIMIKTGVSSRSAMVSKIILAQPG